MKAFITGVTGFVGSHVARALAAQGAELRLLVRPTSRLDNIADLRADLATGDVDYARGCSGQLLGINPIA